MSMISWTVGDRNSASGGQDCSRRRRPLETSLRKMASPVSHPSDSRHGDEQFGQQVALGECFLPLKIPQAASVDRYSLQRVDRGKLSLKRITNIRICLLPFVVRFHKPTGHLLFRQDGIADCQADCGLECVQILGGGENGTDHCCRNGANALH